MDVTEIAWLAGLLEGDGSFQLHKNGTNSRIPLISLSMLDKDIVDRVSIILECNVNGYLTLKKDKIIYSARSAKRSVIEPLLPALYPYMGKRRKEQIIKMLNWYKENPSKIGGVLAE